MNTLEYAMLYRQRGFSVIPLKAKDKKPAIDWKPYQTRRATEEELARWFREPSDLNIGIVTGSLSNIDVIDCDSQEAIILAKKNGLPTGLQVITGKGKHFFFRHKEGASNFQKRDDLPGIDFRAEGGYVVAPPSIHPNGSQYKFDPIANNIPQLPEWIFAKKEQPKTTIVELYKGTGEGGRNQALARMAGVWVKTLSLEDSIEMGLTWNSKNNPPLPLDEVKRTVTSIFKAENKSNQVDTVQDTEIKSVSELQLDLKRFYKNGYEPGLTPGWSSLEPHYTIRKGEWTLVTGIPGSGKSNFLDNLMINMIKHHEWKFGIFSAENYPHTRHLAGLVEEFVGKPFREGFRTERMTEETVEATGKYLLEKIFFLDPPEDKLNVSHILLLASKLIQEQQIDGLIIDPWNELDHQRPNNFTETEYIAKVLTQIRRFARINRIHIWLVAHPAKMQKIKDSSKYPVPTAYDVQGSAHWRNKADNVMVIHREFKIPEDYLTTVHIQKIRFREVGKIGQLTFRYEPSTGKYFDTDYGSFNSESEDESEMY